MTPTSRPILFSGPMIHAILAGKKSQTRRVIKPQPRQLDTGKWYWQPRKADDGVYVDMPFGAWWSYAIVSGECPYGQTGDLLWVRETFCVVDDRDYGGDLWVDYRATPRYAASHPAGWDNAPDDAEALKWKPSIHMPRKYSRITLEVSAVRVERVRDITDDDAIEEGVDRTNTSIPTYARQRFQKLWDSINQSRGYGWEVNPWVWCISFRSLTP